MPKLQPRHITINPEITYNLSPLLLSGSFIASGMPLIASYELSREIIRTVPKSGISENQFFALCVSKLPHRYRNRFVTLNVVRKFLVSPKSHSPLFIFLGGLAGKTTLTGYLAQHLSINRVISIDEEKYTVREANPEKEFLWQATYATRTGYMKTVDSLLPHMVQKIEHNFHDYHDHKKWCYLWEGIYLLPKSLAKITKKHPGAYCLSVFSLPEFDEIKNRYLYRWLQEQGLQKMQLNRELIDQHLGNIEVIRNNITEQIDPVVSYVIESKSFDDQLYTFYGCLHEKLSEIASKELPGWVSKIQKDPLEMKLLDAYLEN